MSFILNYTILVFFFLILIHTFGKHQFNGHFPNTQSTYFDQAFSVIKIDLKPSQTKDGNILSQKKCYLAFIINGVFKWKRNETTES